MYVQYLYSYGCFLKWWYPTTLGFPTKHDHFGVFWGYHHLRKHPYSINIIYMSISVMFVCANDLNQEYPENLPQGVENKQANDHPLASQNHHLFNPPLGFDDMKKILKNWMVQILVWCFRDPIFQRMHGKSSFYRNTIAKHPAGSWISHFFPLDPFTKGIYWSPVLGGNFIENIYLEPSWPFFCWSSDLPKWKGWNLKDQSYNYISFSSTIGV